MTTGMRIDCDVSYDAVLDRLVGGDFVREVNGNWIRSFLMPSTYAKQLRDRLRQLDTAFRTENGIRGGSVVPYPQGLALMSPGGLPGAIDGRPQLVPLDLAFSGTQLRSAPARYRDILQLVCFVEDPTTLAERRPDTAAGLRQLGMNLFSVLRCVHRRLHLALTRGAGSSVGESTVSPAGHLQDPYFLVGPGDLPGSELHRGQEQDIMKALNLLIGLGAGREATGGLLSDAVATYWRTQSLPSGFSGLMDRATSSGHAPRPKTVSELAAAIMSGGW